MSALVAKELQEQNKILAEILAKSYLDKVYPVGSIYMSVSNTDPSTTIGGTWQRLKDRFLLGAGDTYSAGATGGNATHTHALTKAWADMHLVRDDTSNRPKGILLEKSREHSSQTTTMTYSLQDNGSLTRWDLTDATVTDPVTSSHGTALGGNTDATSNIPPYLAVYMWKRIA